MKRLKPFFLTVVFVFGFLIFYYIKCQLGICFIQNFPLDKYPPFNLLQSRNPHQIVYSPLINFDLLPKPFSFLPGRGIWIKLWMREDGLVRVSHDPDGRHRSPCLTIISNSTEGWTLEHVKLIQVKPGDVYSFSGWVKTSGQGAVGALSVVIYDKDRRVIKWKYAEGSFTHIDHWQEIEKEFTVPAGVSYIKFQLTGRGIGKIWFDDLHFMKEK